MFYGHRISTRLLRYSIPPPMASCRCKSRPSVRYRPETEHIGHSTCYSPVHTAANVHLAIRCAQVLNVKETWRPISKVVKTVPGDSRGPSEVVPVSAPRPSARVGLMPFGLGFWLCLRSFESSLDGRELQCLLRGLAVASATLGNAVIGSGAGKVITAACM